MIVRAMVQQRTSAPAAADCSGKFAPGPVLRRLTTRFAPNTGFACPDPVTSHKRDFAIGKCSEPADRLTAVQPGESVHPPFGEPGSHAPRGQTLRSSRIPIGGLPYDKPTHG